MLRLVVQHGRTFQRAHPHVRVLSDKGRYLVVAVDPADVMADDFACFSVREVPWGTRVFEVRQCVARRPTEAVVQKCVDALSAEQFGEDLRTLVGFGTRHATSLGFSQAADWARDQLEAARYHVHTRAITVHGQQTRNVIAEHSGTAAEPREVVIVAAHLDSINVDGGPAAAALGADDNGSGSAGLLVATLHPVRWGRAGAVRQQSLCRVTVVRGEVTDTRGGEHGHDRVQEHPGADCPVGGAALSQNVIDALAEAAHTYTGLTVQTSLSPYNSDHVPFIDAGIPAVLTIEGADGANDNINTANDTLQFVDVDLAMEILRMNVAFVVKTVGDDPGGRRRTDNAES